jgi:hypothetical protein
MTNQDLSIEGAQLLSKKNLDIFALRDEIIEDYLASLKWTVLLSQ